jgi:putative aldouronate transport system permease protein
MTTTSLPAGRGRPGAAPSVVQPVMPARRRRRPEWFTVLAYLVISVSAVACLLPFWLLITGSLTDNQELVLNGYSFWPAHWSGAAYQYIFAGGQVVRSYLVSIYVTLVGTTLALTTTTMLAYSIACPLNRWSRPLAMFTYFPMIFSGGLVPFYLWVTEGLKLGDNLWAVILPMLVNPFFAFIMVSFFRKLPAEILESARMDGASEVTIFLRVVLPLSKPILATIGLFYALAYWNDWFYALLFLQSESKYPLQLLLQNMLSNVTFSQTFAQSSEVTVPSYSLRMAVTLIAIGPIVFVYPFVQRHFVRGLTLGGVKG